MKKLTSAFLAAMMVLSLSVPSFAVTTENREGCDTSMLNGCSIGQGKPSIVGDNVRDTIDVQFMKPYEELNIGDIIYVNGKPEVIFRINPDGSLISMKEDM